MVKKTMTICLMFLSVGVLPAQAASLSFDSGQSEYAVGDTFVANLKIDPQGECLNVVKADISFPKDVLEALDFIKSDSILVFWVEGPDIRQEEGIISFAGGIPGGYCGKISGDSGSGNIVGKIAFKVKNAGVGLAELKIRSSSQVLLNDGAGTKADLSFQDMNFTIKDQGAASRDEWSAEKGRDGVPPETFAINIEHDSSIFDGKYFAMFDTSDKQTGIDHYEIREGYGGWIKAKSPYLLLDQSLKSPIEVRALDKAGNLRIAKLDAPKPSNLIGTIPLSAWPYILITILWAGMGTIFYLVGKKLKAKKI